MPVYIKKVYDSASLETEISPLAPKRVILQTVSFVIVDAVVCSL